MKIKITEQKYKGKIIGYIADFIELPGSPTVGTGKTKEEAVATLFIRNYKELSKLDMTSLEINNNPYEDYTKRE